MACLGLDPSVGLLYGDERLSVDGRTKSVSLDGVKMVLTRKECELLSMLAFRKGQICRREDLLMQIWGYSTAIRTRTLDVHIRRLRRRLDPTGHRYIETLFGVGYRFQPRPAARATPALRARVIAGGALAVSESR